MIFLAHSREFRRADIEGIVDGFVIQRRAEVYRRAEVFDIQQLIAIAPITQKRETATVHRPIIQKRENPEAFRTDK